ncbi:MAG: PIG-L family deacetylase [Candidatus Synoicihabitans palmerolidicus]|nr:PIG-L family deacetylase [Candidatus Synoicihabitans palmerolidicus]
MNLSRAEADIYVPAGGDPGVALGRVTPLCLGAHQDDIEIMAHTAICECLDKPISRAFGGVVVTDGAKSSQAGPYANKSDEEMKVIRREEQRRAAELGRYAIQVQLAHPSAQVKDGQATEVKADLAEIFAGCTFRKVLVHNPMNKHDTHVAVLLRSLAVMRDLPRERRPEQVLGVEVWRGLDWLVEEDKIALDTGQRPELRVQLLEVFDSHIFGGKRYDLATEGRRAANATYHHAHESDQMAGLSWAMDLTPLLDDPTRDLADYALGYVDRLREDVASRIERMT